jgi:hypothetical protein
MTREEMTELMQFIAAVCPQQRIDRLTTVTWYEVIGELGFAEARDAVLALKHSQAFIDVSDIVREATRPAKAHPSDRTVAEALAVANRRELGAAPAMAPELGGLWREAHARATRASQERRARVLLHADLAARLCRPPLGYGSPEQWNGFVPPRYLPGDMLGVVRINTAPRRAALAEICAEAMQRPVKGEGEPVTN